LHGSFSKSKAAVQASSLGEGAYRPDNRTKSLPLRGIERLENSTVCCFQWFERPEKAPVERFQWFERPEKAPVERFQ
jgi:hypothetical protein